MTTAIPQNKFFLIKDKIKSFFSNKLNIVFFGLFSILLLYYCFFISDNSKDIRLTSNDSYNAKFISIDEPFEAKISLSTKKLSQIRFFVQSNDGKELENDDFKIQINNVPESQYSLKIENHLGKTSYLKFYFKNLEKNKYIKNELSVTIQSEKATLRVLDNNEIVYKEYGPLIILPIILIPLLVIISFFFFYFVFKSNSWKKEKKFLFFAIILGSVYIFVRPPCSQYDDLIHYDVAYNMSNIMMGYGNAQKTGVLPKRECDLNLLPDYYPDEYSIHSHAWNGIFAEYYLHFAKNIFNTDGMNVVDSFADKVTIKPQRAFLFSALAITFGRLLNFNQFLLYYFGAFVNFFIGIFLIYFSCKKNKFLDNNIILILSLFPVVLLELGSYSYDSLLISVAFAVINYSIYYFYSENKSKKDLFILIALCLFLFPIKTIYFPISLLYIFMLIWSKIKRFYPKYLPHTILILLGCYGILYLITLIPGVPFIHNQGTNYIDTSCQNYSIAYIIQNPIFLFKIIINSFLSESYTNSIHDFFIFVAKTTEFLPIMKQLYVILFISLFLIKNRIKNLFKIPNILVFVLVSIFIYIVCITWTAIGETTTWGFQARYLLPVLPLLFYSTEGLIPEQFTVRYSTVMNYTLILCYFYLIDMFLRIIM